ncbi:hypothetical protein ACWQV9_09895 [Brevundimonas diminuta]
MTHPITPREKVAQIIKEKVSGPHFTDPSHFVAMEQDRFIAADAILSTLASGSGDHAELAKKVSEGQRLQKGPYTAKGPYRHDEIAALLAEIAALRDEHVHLVEQKEGAEDALFNALSRATEAERKLAEADQVIREISETAQISRVRHLARTFLSKEAERG